MSPMTRREFLKTAGLVTGGLMLSGGLGKVLYDLFTSTSQDYLGATKDTIERLKRTDNPQSWIYLGNVNDFDERIGAYVPLAIDPTQTPSFIIPGYVTNAVKNKKDALRVLYLDSGLGNPYRQKVDKVAQVVETGIKELFPSLQLTVSTDVLPWRKGMVWTPGAIANYEVEEEFIPGQMLQMAINRKYLLLAEDPELVSPGLAGAAHKLFSNAAGVRVPQGNNNQDFFYRTTVHETGHIYGLPHCWEAGCAMSYDFLSGRKDFAPTPRFNQRCKMIGNNIINGDVIVREVPFDPQNDPTKKIQIGFLQSARSISESTAKYDLETHLLRYLSDVSPSLQRVNDLELETHLGKETDEVILYQGRGKRILGRIFIDKFVRDIITP